MNRTANIFVSTILAVGAMTGVAAADPYKDRPQVVVEIADLNLDRAADQAELVKRVDRGARQICRDTATRIDGAKCAAETIEYTMTLVPAHVRHAYMTASDRHESFALTENR